MIAILGISAYYHDSAASLWLDGILVAAAQEERFTRIKNDASFPKNAVRFVLEYAGIEGSELTGVVFYEKPIVKFERLLETYHAFAPKGLKSFMMSMPLWIKEKVFMKEMLKKELKKLSVEKVPLLFSEHHLSHAASAFFPSPYEEATILTIDGVGEWATTTIGYGSDKNIKILKELHFPHSLGLLYSAFTYYLGFKVNSGEYKLMGLAPYGDLSSKQTNEFIDKIKTNIIDIKEDGSFLLNMKYFSFATGLKMTNNKRWQDLFGFKPRKSESELMTEHANLALAIQIITEEIIMKLAKQAKEITQSENLVMAGGVALNSVANGKLLKSGLFKNIWIQQASGDAGGAVGAAYVGAHIWKNEKRKITYPDSMNGGFLGPEYSNKEIEINIRKYLAKAEYYEDIDKLIAITAQKIAEGKVVGWFQGRMEFGPRALGNRSILGDARNAEMQKKMNLKIKYREGFRPFAPSVLEEDTSLYFDINVPSPYMLMVVPVVKERQITLPSEYQKFSLFEKLYFLRSDVPAITHVDYSARVQTVCRETNEKYWKLINELKKQTGYSVIINTSFNVRGEPIVCSPQDALNCFFSTEMDFLVMGNYLLDKAANNNVVVKTKQPIND